MSFFRSNSNNNKMSSPDGSVQLQVNITIVGARDLPKTDRLSAIDPCMPHHTTHLAHLFT